MKNEWQGFKGKFWGKVFVSPFLRYVFGFYIFSNKHAKIIKKTIKENLKDGSTLVDLGSGSGFYTILSSKINENGKIIAVDLSNTMLGRLKETMEKKGIGKNVEIRNEDIEHTTIAENTADIIVLSNVLHELKDARDIIKEMNRILKPGGVIIASEFIDNDFGRKFLSHHQDEVHGPYSPVELREFFDESKFFSKIDIDAHLNRVLAIVRK